MGGNRKVRGGKMGEGQAALPAALQEEIAQKWAAVVAPQTGLASYTALRER